VTTRSAVALTLGIVASACGGAKGSGPAFASDWQSDDGKSIAAVYARVGQTKVPAGRGLAVGISDSGLVARTLDGSSKWARPGPVDSRPSIAGNVVVVTAQRKLIAVDGATGKDLWSVDVGDKRLRGAGDDGRSTVASLESPSGGGSLLVAIDRSGHTVGHWTPEAEIGVPAVVADVVFIPWGNQYVSALDIGGGSEAGRLLGRTVMSHAVAIGGSVYFGETALVRFDDAISKAGRNEAHVVKLPERELPGKPAWFPDGTRALPAEAGAPDSIRYYARPAEEAGKLGLDSGRFAATYFRIAVGFDAHDAATRWAASFPEEIIGGDAASGGFAFCDPGGTVWLVGARGGEKAGQVALGAKLKGCVVSGGDFVVNGGESQGSLPEQITRIVELRESQMGTIQRFLLRELGTNQDPTVTKTLVDVASDARTSKEILDEARSLLASRRTGAEYMLEALGRHYDFLSDVLRSPPVGPIADALAAMGEKRAAPLLAQHLNDPSDTPNDVRRAAHALVMLASPAELEAVRTFFALYHATADDDELIASVIDAAKILVEVGGADGRALVKRAADDPLTNPGIKEGIKSVLPKES
jgi:outer membrane protein assembly factor BamB